MERLMMLATIMSAILAVEKIIKLIPLSTYERQRMDDALFYLEGLYRERKKKKTSLTNITNNDII